MRLIDPVSTTARPVSTVSTGRRRWAASTQIPIAGASTAMTIPAIPNTRPSQAVGVVGPVRSAPTVPVRYTENTNVMTIAFMPVAPQSHAPTLRSSIGLPTRGPPVIARGCSWGHSIGPYDWRHARTRSQPRCARRRHRRLAEHRRSVGHRARRARTPPDRHRATRGGTDRSSSEVDRPLRRHRRGSGRRPGRPRFAHASCATNSPPATCRSSAPMQARQRSGRWPTSTSRARRTRFSSTCSACTTWRWPCCPEWCDAGPAAS